LIQRVATAQPVTAYKIASVTVDLADPPNGPIQSVLLHAFVGKLNALDNGEVRLSLLQGSTLLSQGSWQTVTAVNSTSEFQLNSSPSITDSTQLRALVEIRTTTTCTPLIDQVYADVTGGIGTATRQAVAQRIFRGLARNVGTALRPTVPQPVARKKSLAINTVLVTREVVPILRKPKEIFELIELKEASTVARLVEN